MLHTCNCGYKGSEYGCGEYIKQMERKGRDVYVENMKKNESKKYIHGCTVDI